MAACVLSKPFSARSATRPTSAGASVASFAAASCDNRKHADMNKDVEDLAAKVAAQLSMEWQAAERRLDELRSRILALETQGADHEARISALETP